MEFTKETFFVQHLALKPVGLKLESDKFKNLYTFCTCSIFTSIIAGASLRLGFENLDSVDEFSEIVAPGIVSCIAVFKGIIFIRNHETLAKFVAKLRNYIEQANDEEEVQVLMKENQHDKYICGIFYVLAIFATIASIIGPTAVMVVLYATTGEFTVLLPYKGNFIVDPSKFYNYCAILAISCLSVFFVLQCTSIVDSLFCWYCHNIVAQFRILAIKLKQANMKHNKDAAALEAAIIPCIKRHQDIIAIAKELNQVYEPIAFVQFSLSSLQACLIAYQIINGVALSQLPFLSTFLIAVCLQMANYSYNGGRLKAESENFALGVYEAICWENDFIRSRKSLMLVMRRAQKPIILTGIFFHINWNLFVEVMKTTFSYITLMRSLKQE